MNLTSSIPINRERFEQVLKDKGMSKYRLAKEMGIPLRTIQRCINQTQRFTFSTLVNACTVLGVPISSVSDVNLSEFTEVLRKVNHLKGKADQKNMYNSSQKLYTHHAITIIRKKPNEIPEFAVIDNTIEALREQVEGFFEIIGSKEHTGNFVVNTYYNRERDEGEEEGEFNCTVEGHNFRGTILYIGPLAGDFEDAPRETVDLLLIQRQHKTLGTKRWLW